MLFSGEALQHHLASFAVSKAGQLSVDQAETQGGLLKKRREMETQLKGLVKVRMSFVLNIEEQEAVVTRAVRLMAKDLRGELGEDTIKKTTQLQLLPLLLTLLPRAPKRVLLPGVIGANRMRLSLVQKERKPLFFDQRMGRCDLSLYSPHSSQQALSRAAVQGSCQQGGRQRSCGAGTAALLKAPGCSAGCSVSAHGLLPPPS